MGSQYSIFEFQKLFGEQRDLGETLYRNSAFKIEIFHLRKDASIIYSRDEVDKQKETNECVLVLKGSIEVILPNEKLFLKAGQMFVNHEYIQVSIFATEETDLLGVNNDNAEDLDEEAVPLMHMVMQVEQKDPYTRGHNLRVSKYTCAILQIMEPGYHKTVANIAALCHDVGKMRIDQEILNAERKLTAEEFDEIKKHPAYSYEMIKEYMGEEPARLARAHHEKLDGSGYPDGLTEDEIPIESKVMAVADIFDALTTSRCYRKAFSFEKALSIMKEDVEKRKIDATAFQILCDLIAGGAIVEGRDDES